MSETKSSHFQGKDAIGHVAEAQASGIITAAEAHGLETPGSISAAADSARESALFFILLWTIFANFLMNVSQSMLLLAILAAGWLIWKTGRSAWLGWYRLERLHRIIAQERWEIEHNRPQEREELAVLYSAKGFEGPLLEDVLDVLMADGDRLLKVMVEEELGLRLGNYQHPLIQCFGAAIGTLSAFLLCWLGWLLQPEWGVFLGATIALIAGTVISAYSDKNQYIRAVVWNLGIAFFAWGVVNYLIDFFFFRELIR